MASDLNGAGRGLNFVVVNPETKEVVRVARFDTFASGSVIKDADFKKTVVGQSFLSLLFFSFIPFLPSVFLNFSFIFPTLSVPEPPT